MIKGVSKQILEVTNTDNPYFDKIIFLLSPNISQQTAKNFKRSRGSCGFKAKPPKLKLTKRQIIKTAVLSLLLQWQGAVLHLLLHY